MAFSVLWPQTVLVYSHFSYKNIQGTRRILEINAKQLSLQEKQPAFQSVIDIKCYILSENLTQAYNTFTFFQIEIVCYLPNLTSNKKQKDVQFLFNSVFFP